MLHKPIDTLTDQVSRAEFLLSVLCKNAKDFTVYYCGDAKRNYCGELLSIDFVEKEAKICRNGLMQILPSKLLFGKEELKNLKEYNKKKKELERFFNSNFDRIVFLLELKWERTLSQLEGELNTLLLKDLFGIDIPKERSQEESLQEIQKLARLIPGGQYLKGDVKMLARVSQDILKHEIMVTMTDDKVSFTVMIDDLTPQGYQEKKASLKIYFDKLAEWFLPYDCICSYEIKAHRRHLKLGESLILNYNTKLWKRG